MDLQLKNQVTENSPSHWLITPGWRLSKWKEWYQKGIVAIGWGECIKNFKQYQTEKEIQHTLQQYKNNHPEAKIRATTFENVAREIHQFTNVIKIGDVIYVKGNDNTICGRGIVSSEHIYNTDGGEYSNMRQVIWTHNGEWLNPSDTKHSNNTLLNIDNWTSSYREELKALFDAPFDDSHSEEEKEKHASVMSLDILNKAAAEDEKRVHKPKISTTTQYYRSPYVKKFAKDRANGCCQLCEQSAPFIDKNGETYLEVHHIIWLSNNGTDTRDNVVALCPNCHKKMHILNFDEDIIKLKEKAKLHL